MNLRLHSLADFEEYDSAYCALSKEVDGHLYFGLCTHRRSHSAGFFRQNLASGRIELLFRLSDLIETPLGSLNHGKIHTKIQSDHNDVLYFGTHFAYPDCVPCSVQFSGGHLMSFDSKVGRVDDHGILMEGEGIISMKLDVSRMRCYCLTSPSFWFLDYDLSHRELVSKFRIKTDGSICRNLALEPNGFVFGCREGYEVFRYDPSTARLKFIDTNLEEVSNPSTSEWTSPNKTGANMVGRTLWRDIEYHEESGLFFGINASSSEIFQFDGSVFRSVASPVSKEEQDRIYPTLSFCGGNGSYYYCGSNGRFDYKLSEDIRGPSSLVSFCVDSGTLTKHGNMIGPNSEVVLGTAAATYVRDRCLFFLGAVSESTGRHQSDNFLRFGSQNYELALIEMSIIDEQKSA